MGWLPDDVWEAQKKKRQQSKGKGKGQAKGAQGEDLQALTASLMQNPGMLGLLSQLMGASADSWDSWGSGKGGGKGGAWTQVSDDQVNWKGELCTAFQKSAKKSSTPEDIVYTFVEEDGSSFKAQVTVAGKSFIGDKVAGKKKAEASAAKKALKALYKSHDLSKAYETAASMAIPAASASKGTKRKHVQPATESVKMQDQPAKNRLLHAICLILGRATTKDEVVFSVAEAEGGFVATVAITVTGSSFVGEVQDSKKKAEASAAEVALASMGNQVADIEAAHQERKKQKKAEQMAIQKAKWKLQEEEKKAAKAAKALAGSS
jgi:dsRNA-specific ribonuclease